MRTRTFKVSARAALARAVSMGIANAACAAAFLALAVVTSDAASADAPEMFIENKSADTTLYLEATSGISEAPQTIPPGTTSGEIKAGKNARRGLITYMNNQNNDDATCTVTINFDLCGNAGISTSSTGACTLVRDGGCYGKENCKCNFDFSD